MMILPLADSLQNCLQNLTSRIAGIDNEQMTNRVIGMGSMIGFGLGAVKEQFKTPTTNIKTGNSDNNNSSGLSGFVSRAKSIINPSMNLSSSTDYNGNNNPIREVIPNKNSTLPKFSNSKSENDKDNNLNMSENKFSKVKSVASNIANTGYNATKTYLQVGANMAEGNFNMNSHSYKSNNRRNNYKKDYQNTEYANTTSKSITTEKGDANEFEGKS